MSNKEDKDKMHTHKTRTRQMAGALLAIITMLLLSACTVPVLGVNLGGNPPTTRTTPCVQLEQPAAVMPGGKVVLNLLNCGNTTWPQGVKLQRTEGFGPEQVTLPAVQAMMRYPLPETTAPQQPGTYRLGYRALDPDGTDLGTIIINAQVQAPQQALPSPTATAGAPAAGQPTAGSTGTPGAPTPTAPAAGQQAQATPNATATFQAAVTNGVATVMAGNQPRNVGSPTPGAGASSGQSQTGSGMQQNTTCDKHGTVAWHAPTQPNDRPYGLNVLGGVNETCWVVSQTWTQWMEGGVLKKVRFAFAVRPHHTIRWKDFVSGTGWYFGGSEADVRANLQQQLGEINARKDPQMEEHVVILPEDAARFSRLLVEHILPPTGTGTTGVTSGSSASGASVQPTQAPTSGGQQGGQQTAGRKEGNTCYGPAIVEDATPPGTIYKVNEGESRTFLPGECWPYPSQAALDDPSGYPDHRAKFLAKNARYRAQP